MNFYNSLNPSQKAAVISTIAILLAFTWFLFLSNFTASQAEEDLTFSETQDLLLIDCSGDNRNSPLCVEREEALDALKILNDIKDNLLDINVETWSKEEYSIILSKKQQGDDLFDQGFYGKAKLSYQSAIKESEELVKEGKNLFSSYVKQGYILLDQEKDEEAKIQFENALIIIPNDRNALIGVERASVFKEVVKFQKEAELFIKVGDFNDALQSVNKAAQLDSINQKTKNLRISLDKLILDRNLNEAIDDGYFYLEKKDYQNARASFERAIKINKLSQSALTGIDLVVEGEKRLKINADRLMAEKYFFEEKFSKSVSYYSSILKIDSTLAFANDGLSRANQYINLEKKIDRYLNRPDRLASKAVFIEANQLLAQLRGLKFGERLAKKRQDLIVILDDYSSLVTLRITSDNRTQISIQNGENLGVFFDKELKIYPGKYTFVGKRKNYVTVRRVLEIRAATSIYLSCLEKI